MSSQTPQGFIYDWAFTNNHKVFVNLDKERYWLVSTIDNSNIYNFEHNNTSDVPDYDYDVIKQAMKEEGFSYYEQ